MIWRRAKMLALASTAAHTHQWRVRLPGADVISRLKADFAPGTCACICSTPPSTRKRGHLKECLSDRDHIISRLSVASSAKWRDDGELRRPNRTRPHLQTTSARSQGQKCRLRTHAHGKGVREASGQPVQQPEVPSKTLAFVEADEQTEGKTTGYFAQQQPRRSTILQGNCSGCHRSRPPPGQMDSSSDFYALPAAVHSTCMRLMAWTPSAYSSSVINDCSFPSAIHRSRTLSSMACRSGSAAASRARSQSAAFSHGSTVIIFRPP